MDRKESKQNKPLLITGPCSAESEQQLRDIANQLIQSGNVDVFRAGVWKPRTRPGSFEGFGQEALPWLQRVQKEYNIPVTIEVGNAQHVELALKHDIQSFWVGARTTVNPFYIQEIAEALKGNEVEVFVKNPIHPDIELWDGGIERFLNVGIDQVAAIHRGFSSFQQSKYRNIPRWEIPIELRRRYPNLKMICDVSHIVGNRALIQEVTQKAMDLGVDGLMIEVHQDPDHALSDAQQQITPRQLDEMLSQIKLKTVGSDDRVFLNQLDELRSQIDKIDEDIIQAIASRLHLTEEIGVYKRDNDVMVLQIERWNDILRTRGAVGEKLGLSSEFIHKLFQIIHSESIKIQTKVVDRN